jgi:ABC-type nickel/cobalt efflux system permease component RcnA
VHLAFTQGPVPAGAAPIAPRKGEKIAAGSSSGQRSGIRATGVSATWLNQATKSLVDLISARHVAPHVMALALLIALVLGALHAFSPGHGKTVVGAYLIGSRGTIRHAVFLGITVTVTHTLGVFALGLATLFASQFVMPAKLFPILSLVSGLLVVVIGLTLFIRRLRGGRHEHAHSHDPAPVPAAGAEAERPVEIMAEDANAVSREQKPASARASALSPAYAGVAVADAGHRHEHMHGHQHTHDHPHAHHHDHAHGHSHTHGALTHTHGGSTHTHAPPGSEGEKVTWKSLLGLGISGGLIPCPSAMVLLLATIALHKTAYGLVLVLAFSLGLAITLTGVGTAFLYARRLFGRARVPGRLVQTLPIISAGIITCIGIVICYGAIAGVSIRV